MMFDPERYHRHSIRWQGYDYSLPGGYFVTICTHNRELLLGDIVDSRLQLNAFGQIVHEHLLALPNYYDHVLVDCFVIMPNHVHAIIELTEDDCSAGGTDGDTRADKQNSPRKRHDLTEIVRGFKTFSAREINRLRESPGRSVWQRSFYDRVIRDEREWSTFRWYIAVNPTRWVEDREYQGDI